jgi:hypothetical protein
MRERFAFYLGLLGLRQGSARDAAQCDAALPRLHDATRNCANATRREANAKSTSVSRSLNFRYKALWRWPQ